MKFEIPFDQNLYKEQMDLHFNITWADYIKKNKKNIYLSIPFCLMGILMVYGKSNLGFIFIAFGIIYMFTFYNRQQHYKNNKKKYSLSVDEFIFKNISSNNITRWEFTENELKYKDFQYDLRMKWTVFSKTQVIKDHLFISFGEDISSSYIIGEKEVGKENFLKIVEFVKSKILIISH